MEKKSLLLKDMNDAEPRARSEVQGYQRNGYHFLELAEEDNTGLFQLQKVRWATDHHSWSFKLPVLPAQLRRFTDYVSPAQSTSWAIITYVEDYHRMRCEMWNDDPCFFPILHATSKIKDMFVNILVDNEEQWMDMDHFVGGNDQ